jgi:hypothetical protein
MRGPLLGADDRARLEMLCTVARRLAARRLKVAKSLIQGTRRSVAAAEKVELEREELFTKAEHAANAMQRRDPIGRAWHEGLLDGHGVDAVVLRDIGRQFGFLYWHEYRDRSTRPSAAIRTWWRSARCGCARRARMRSAPCGRPTARSSTDGREGAPRCRPALRQRYVVRRGPDGSTGMINSSRVLRGDRKWSRDCSGYEPSLSCLQKAADDAADLIEIVWRVVKMLVFTVPIAATGAAIWFKLRVGATILAGYKQALLMAVGIIIVLMLYEAKDAAVRWWRSRQIARNANCSVDEPI